MDLEQLKSERPPPKSDDSESRVWRRKVGNLVKAWDEFEEKREVLTTMPFKAIVELTQNCNFKCIMCPQSWEEAFKKYNPEFNMPVKTFVKIAEELFPTATFIDLRGFGETTILPYWPEIVDYLASHPFIQWHLVTNLSLKNDVKWEQMIKLGFALGFSCDGATKETFESIRRRSRFETILHNLGVIRDAIERHQSGFIYFISTIQKRNIAELRGIVELAHRFSVSEVQFKVVQAGGHAEVLDDVPPDEVQRHVNDALAAAIDLNVRVTFNDWIFTKGIDGAKIAAASAIKPKYGQPLPPRPSFAPTYWDEKGAERIIENIVDASRVSVNQRCFKPFGFTYINFKAQMGTCNHMMYPDMQVMGDLKTQSIMEVWNGAAYQDFRRQLLYAQPRDPRCQWCFKHRLDD